MGRAVVGSLDDLGALQVVDVGAIKRGRRGVDGHGTSDVSDTLERDPGNG